MEKRLSKVKSEALGMCFETMHVLLQLSYLFYALHVDDNVLVDDNQIKLRTFKRLEGSIIEEHDIGVEEKQEPIKDNCDVDQDDKKSITEDVEEQKK